MKQFNKEQTKFIEKLILDFLDVESKGENNLITIHEESEKKIELWKELYKNCKD